MDWKGIHVWNEPMTSVRIVKGRRFFPLDHKLKLRADHWSEGAARVATRQGLQGKSFDLAAEAYMDAVGGSMSGDSMRRITEGWGKAVDEKRNAEVEVVYAASEPGERYDQCPIEEVEAIQDQANISTDGGMVWIRTEGWKEVKLTTISEVQVKTEQKESIDEQDPAIRLGRHSYQAGLWDADEIGQHQYVEGLRRRIEDCQRLSSVNDGAPWIERITTTNYPQAVQIIDWAHASERLWKVSKAVFGEQSPQTQEWVELRLDHLWHGRVEDVIPALQALSLDQHPVDIVRQTPGYFEARQNKMDYARFRTLGYPLGSGTVEGGINSVVHHRMKRPGRGWKRDNAHALLAALGELHSGRFLSSWQAIGAYPN
jgi:hypothetical protein